MTSSDPVKTEPVGTGQCARPSESSPVVPPGASVRWAMHWTGETARCLFHEHARESCVACDPTEHDWFLLHRGAASLVESLNNRCQGSGSIQMVIFVRDNELELTMIDQGEPLVTLAIPPIVEITAAQEWMERWLTLKTGKAPSKLHADKQTSASMERPEKP
jgi:hypothetical protein